MVVDAASLEALALPLSQLYGVSGGESLRKVDSMTISELGSNWCIIGLYQITNAATFKWRRSTLQDKGLLGDTPSRYPTLRNAYLGVL